MRSERSPGAADLDPLYVAARSVLLDTLEALSPEHLNAAIVAGAQAVYLHSGDAALPIAPYTTDGDVVLDPAVLAVVPELEETMRTAGFETGANPGQWITSRRVGEQSIAIPIDLLVPETVAATGSRRSAHLEGHGRRTARKVSGIEAVLVDNAWTDIRALEPGDPRRIRARIAGPTGLLIAKAHKIDDRHAEGTRSHRQDDKDALDLYRLMQTTPVAVVREMVSRLRVDERAAATTEKGLELLRDLFGFPRADGVVMAIRASGHTIPEARIRQICIGFVSSLGHE